MESFEHVLMYTNFDNGSSNNLDRNTCIETAVQMHGI